MTTPNSQTAKTTPNSQEANSQTWKLCTWVLGVGRWELTSGSE